jgi:TonB family protein
MKHILFIAIAFLALTESSFGQSRPVRFASPVIVPDVKPAPVVSRFYVANDMAYAVSVAVSRNGQPAGETNAEGWIYLEDLRKGDTIVFGVGSRYIPKTFICFQGAPQEDIFLMLESQPLPDSLRPRPEPIYTFVDESASFPGGPEALKQYLSDNLRYPEEARKLGIEGKCHLKFIVGKTGEISAVTVVRGVPDCPQCDAEAIRLVEQMPDWIPYGSSTEAKASYYQLSVPFRIE